MKKQFKEYDLSGFRNPDCLNQLLEQAYENKNQNETLKLEVEIVDEKVTVWIV